MTGSASRSAASATIRLLMRKASGCTSSAPGTHLAQSIERHFDLSITACIDDLDLLPKLSCRFKRIPHIRLGDWIAGLTRMRSISMWVPARAEG